MRFKEFYKQVFYYSCNIAAATKTITCFVIFKISKSVLLVSSSGERTSLMWGSKIHKSASLALTTARQENTFNFFFDLLTDDDFYVGNWIDYFKLLHTCGVFQTGAAENAIADFNKIDRVFFSKVLQSPFKHCIKSMNE